MRDLRVFVVAGLSALLAVAVYWNSLSNGLVHDDVSAIERNEAVRDPTDLRTIFLTPSWKARGDLTTISYRPLSTWTLAVDYAFHGTKPFGYHLGNVIGHAAVTILLVVLARATGLSIASAGLAGLLFAVHPVHTEVVANGVGRAEVLAAALALLALLLGRRAAWRGWDLPASLAAASAYGVALLAKEHTVALLLMLPLGDLLLTDGGSLRRFAAGLTGRRKLFYAALGAITAGYLALRATALGGVVGAEGHGFQAILYWANPAASAPLTARILTALRVLAMAVGLLIWPHPLSADYSYRQIPLIDSALAPGALLGIGVAATLAILVAVLWRRGPVACFWLVLALATYAVVSNVFFPIGTIFGERLLYLPSAGFCVLAALALREPRRPVPRAIASLVVVVALVHWSAVTIARNPVWRDEMSLGLDMVRTAPDSVHAHHFLGATYQGEGRDEKALAELGRALEIYPEHLSSLYDVGLIHQRHGDAESALAIYRRILDIDARYFPAWISISAINYGQGSYPAALEAAEHALAIVPELPAAHLVRANALRGLVRHAEARDEYAAALHGDPKMPEALIGLAFSALDLEDFSLAADAFRRLIDVVPSVDAYSGLINSARRAGRAAEAEQALAAARLRYPNDPAFAAAKDAP
jgi:tetratricopeptide (TPR) repeat protein